MKQKFLTLLKRHTTWQLTVALILFWIPVIVFAKLAGEIIEREPIRGDIAILHWIHSLSTPLLDKVFLFFTTIGSVEYVLPLSILILGLLLYKKRRLNSIIFLFGVGGAAAANIILKHLFHRTRPSFWSSAVTETGYSFPSGHAMASSALVLCLIVILWNTRWRVASIIVGGLVVVMIGVSRLYLGVHYPTDVIAGWCVSLVWVTIVVTIAQRLSFWSHMNDFKIPTSS
jgi:undecaprenyl-diphosphatase